MISSFSIGNFKAFSETQHIPLKPITLIYGANSSGKSSIIHALMLAQHAQISGDFDVYHTSKGGESIDFGGFHQYINSHNLSNSLEFVFDFELDKSKISKRSIEISIAVPFDDYGHRVPFSNPEIVRLNVTSHGNEVIRISKRGSNIFGIDQLDPSIEKIKFKHEITIDGKKHYFETKGSDVIAIAQNYELIRRGLLMRPKENIDLSMRNFFAHNKVNVAKNQKEQLSFDTSRLALHSYFVNTMQPIEANLVSFLKSIWYLGPLRTYPPRHIFGSKYNDSNWYAGGGYAWEIVRKDERVRTKINKWLSDTDRLQTPYELTIRELIDINQIEEPIYRGLEELDFLNMLNNELDDPNSHSVYKDDTDSITRRLIGNCKDSIEEKINELVLIDRRSDTAVSHRDIGVGISQVLPVLAYSYANTQSTIAIEQPEIHLHPALQADLGDVFIESALGSNNRFLIETHSEYILLRIMKRLRQTANKELPLGLLPIKPEDVCILFVQPIGASSTVMEIPLNEQGELIKAWPGGFFEEGIRETF